MIYKTITLAMIVKNEQQVIERLLKSVYSAFDQIVIVDTGSTDNTRKICAKYGTVYRYKWTDNFSEARNFAFSKATCQYIMWLDADDIMDQSSIDKLKQWKSSSSNPDTVMAKYVAAKDINGDASVWYYRERIVRNCLLACWQGVIHEAIAPFGEVEYANFEVEHCPIAAHTSRNLRIFRKMIKQGATLDERMTYYYARELYYKAYYSKALTVLKKFVKQPNAYYVDTIEAYKIICRIYMYKEKYRLAVKAVLDALLVDYPDAEQCCLLGDAFLQQNALECAKRWYVLALSCQNTNRGFVNNRYGFYYPLMQLCLTCDRLGQREQSYMYHKMVAQKYPDDPSVVYNEQYFQNYDNTKKLS